MADIVEEIARDWKVTLKEQLPGATCSKVWAGFDQSGNEVVLKVPDDDSEEKLAGSTLLAFSNHGGVTILNHDEPTGAILMPRLHPGTTLDTSGLNDLQQVEVCSDVIRRLRQAQTVEAMSLDRWYRDLWNAPPDELVPEAQSIARRLIDTTTRQTLLHGDLHHFNILRNGDEWVAIDPKGVLGDPAFEITGFMRNPIGRTPDADGMSQRIQRFHECLGDPIDRLWGWAFVQTVLSYIWGDDPEWSDPWRTTARDVRDAGDLLGVRGQARMA